MRSRNQKTKTAKPLSPTARFQRFFSMLGPGIVTGAADDDPSGIATYSIAGAKFGTAFLWSALLTWPLMAFVQMMCAHIAMATGTGLTAALRRKFPAPVLVLMAGALFFANTFNVGADLAAMADGMHILTGLPQPLFVFGLAGVIHYFTVALHYRQIASVLKWLSLSLAAYVIVAFLIHPDWGEVAQATFMPAMPRGHEAWMMLVAILGTTISPYLFFWQASQEVEESDARKGHNPEHMLAYRRLDVSVGTFFSNLVMFFIILATALVLHAHGMTDIQSSRDAALALKPIAGELAMVLYTVGIVTVGLLAIPVLAGSAAYVCAEVFRWPHGLNKNTRQAKGFYAVFTVSIVLGIAMNFLGLNPIHTLLWSAVINGVLAPFLLVGILLVATDSRLMHGHTASLLSRLVVGLTTLLMFAAAIFMAV